MSPADKLKLTNMIEQSVNHTLNSLQLSNPETHMQHFEKVCAYIVANSNHDDADDVTEVLQAFLIKKAEKLKVNRSYTDEQT